MDYNPNDPYRVEPDSPNKKSSKAGIIAGVGSAGIVAGAAIGLGANAYAESREEDIDDTPIVADDVIEVNDQGIQFAKVEADNFSDAFAQAREQVGPGGAFEWNGKVYGTYYETEWNAMSQAEQAEFTAHALGRDYERHEYTAHESHSDQGSPLAAVDHHHTTLNDVRDIFEGHHNPSDGPDYPDPEPEPDPFPVPEPEPVPEPYPEPYPYPEPEPDPFPYPDPDPDPAPYVYIDPDPDPDPLDPFADPDYLDC